MKTTDRSESKRSQPGALEEATFLDLMHTTDMLSRRAVPVFKGEGLSPTQYNVLRILRGSPQGLPSGEIANRMITRDPDVTRLLDRLEKQELIKRWRDAEDRRVVMVQIAPQGLKLLAKLDEPVLAMHRKLLGHMGRQRLQQLSELLREARGQAG